jgi:hypothetical protein
MAYNYQDPRYKNLSKWNIGEEVWQVTGVWSTADDDSGRNARTEALGVRKFENGRYTTGVIRVTKDKFEASINSKRRQFNV